MRWALPSACCEAWEEADVHVLAVDRGPRSFTLVVETVVALVGCPSCAVLATGHGRCEVLLHDLPCAGCRCGWCGANGSTAAS
jgi:transposase